MTHELFYTSAPRGLRPGATGFCTVAMTRGLAPALVDRLESLSGYRPLFSAGDPRSSQNPISFAHWRIAVGPQTVSVLSRVCFAGLDYTQRSNKFAHHLVLGPEERPAAGPAWLLREPGVMENEWSAGEPVELDSGRPLPLGDSPAAPCRAWAAATGDAGWAGALAEAWLADPGKPAYIIYPPGVDALELLAEAIALLPEAKRWLVTFNTYFTDLPAGLSCAWRCCITGTPAAKEAARSAAASGNFVIDLTSASAAAPESSFARFARTGVFEDSAAQPAKSWTFPTAANSTAGEAASPPAPSQLNLSPARDVAVSASGDIDWDPSDSPPAPTRPKRSRPVAKAGWPFWVAMILWPLAVATMAWNHLHRPNQASSPSPPATAPTQGGSISAAENAQLRQQLAQLSNQLELAKKTEFEKGRATASREPPDPRVWVRRTDLPATVPAPAHTDAEYASLAAQLEQVKKDLAKATATASANLPTTGPASHIIRDETGRALSQWIALADTPRGPSTDIRLASWPGSKSPKVTLAVPLASASASVYKQKTSADGSVTVFRPSGSGLSGDVDRARFFLAGDQLMLRWLIDEKDDKDQRAIAAYLLFATARVSDGAGAILGTVQFVEPERCDLYLHDRHVLFKKAMPPPQAGALQLLALTSPGAFSILDGGGAAASMTFKCRSGASFSIDAGAQGISTNWPDINVDALTQKSTFEADIDRLKQYLPKTKKNEIDNGKRSDDKYKATFIAYDQAVDKLRQQAAICDDLNRPFRATLALTLPNGAVLATIEVSREAPKPE